MAHKKKDSFEEQWRHKMAGEGSVPPVPDHLWAKISGALGESPGAESNPSKKVSPDSGEFSQKWTNALDASKAPEVPKGIWEGVRKGLDDNLADKSDEAFASAWSEAFKKKHDAIPPVPGSVWANVNSAIRGGVYGGGADTFEQAWKKAFTEKGPEKVPARVWPAILGAVSPGATHRKGPKMVAMWLVANLKPLVVAASVSVFAGAGYWQINEYLDEKAVAINESEKGQIEFVKEVVPEALTKLPDPIVNDAEDVDPEELNPRTSVASVRPPVLTNSRGTAISAKMMSQVLSDSDVLSNGAIALSIPPEVTDMVANGISYNVPSPYRKLYLQAPRYMPRKRSPKGRNAFVAGVFLGTNSMDPSIGNNNSVMESFDTPGLVTRKSSSFASVASAFEAERPEPENFTVKPEVSWVMEAGWQVTNRVMLLSGLEYSRMSLSGGDPTLQDNNGVSWGDEKLRTIGVPLKIGYKVIDRRLSVLLNAGMTVDFLLNRDDVSAKVVVREKVDYSLRENFVSALAGMDLRYNFSEHYALTMGGGYKYAFTDLSNNKEIFTVNPKGVTMKIGFSVSF
ncbi:hypothetical protein FUAX_19930 [Fulvitalea axinellae]|uniref:Outer membrane protein beta-barrel domain-containing protein n=1 Tax=Fulvitalea axinellae TaxID=1182444 RepID=A0AAU9CBK3_9BACT|nr:hypothetical protein FUAX_19930 [Fulvitalea axinellae]